MEYFDPNQVPGMYVTGNGDTKITGVAGGYR